MTDTTATSSPPYATFGSFAGFLNKLRDDGLPNRIDASVFGNASGSIKYSVLAALKYLGLIDSAGKPSKFFADLVTATDEERPIYFAQLIRSGYPSLFEKGVDLDKMTAGQFDEHFRVQYQVKGSTIDKIAAFFIALAKAGNEKLSSQLLSRKATSASVASQRSSKQRKRDSVDVRSDEAARPPAQQPAAVAKQLEYQLIDLMSEPDIDEQTKQSIWSLVQYLMARKAKGA